MATAAKARSSNRLLVYLLVGAAVSVSLGVSANVHDPTGQALVSLSFTGSINLKVWFGTAASAPA